VVKISRIKPQSKIRPIKKELPIRVKNYDELKKNVYQDIQHGISQRDILPKKFSVNGKIIGLYPARVREIKEEFEKTEHVNEEPNHVKLFKLFQKGYTPTAALIETKCTFEEVNEAHQQFLSFENKTDVSEDYLFKIDELALDVAGDRKFENHDDVIFYLNEAVEDALKYREFTYPCKKCGKPLRVSDSNWPDIREFLIENGWGHKKCP